MREIQASEAQTRLRLDVERGALVLTRHGRRIGRIIPEGDRRHDREDHSGDEAAVLRVARAHQLSIYDAAYLELAQRVGIPLAAFDVRLQKQAVEAGVVPLAARRPEASA
jgi:predicted nucleic acid-binding protein